MKWAGFEDSENEWLPKSKMSSTFLVFQFETKDRHYIYGVRDENGLIYATYGQHNEIHMIQSEFAQEMWIVSVINFLWNRIEFQMPNDAIELAASTIGLPDEITGNFL